VKTKPPSHTGELLPFKKYILTNELGHSYYGETDENGLTKTFYSDKSENYSLQVLVNDIKDLNSQENNNG